AGGTGAAAEDEGRATRAELAPDELHRVQRAACAGCRVQVECHGMRWVIVTLARVGPTTPTQFPNADPEAQEAHDRIGTSDHNTPSIGVSGCDRQITSRRSRLLLHAVRRRASKKQRQIAGNLTPLPRILGLVHSR